MLRPFNARVVGAGEHRSGWPFCMAALDPLFDPDSPVMLDDFVERTFLYDWRRNVDATHRRPWVGIMHHPPDMPEWYLDNIRLQHLLHDARWERCSKHLKLIIVLGNNLVSWLNEFVPGVPVAVIKHPTGKPAFYWSPEAFLAQKWRPVIQVGWFLRNMVAIHQAKLDDQFRKIHLMPPNDWAPRMTHLCRETYRRMHPERRDHGLTETMPSQDNTQFDALLAESVVLVEVISAVANNTVVECIMRNTPICVNRHPGPLYYLGPDYPLFYDRFEDIGDLLTVDNILAAHEYLKRMDKWWTLGSMFCEQVRAACQQHVPECRATVTLPSQVLCDI